MSYVRLGVDGSQVYIYEDVRGYVVCCFCALNPDWKNGDDFRTTGLEAMLAHLAEHRTAGHHVPAWVDAELTNDWPEFPAEARKDQP